MSDMTHKMWSQWKDFRLNEKKGDHEGQMAKSQLKRSVKLARMNYEIIDGMKKDEDIALKPVTLNKERRPTENLNMTDQVTGSEPKLFN